MKRYLAIVLVALVVITSGCAESQDYDNPEPVNTTSEGEADTSNQASEDESGNSLVDKFSVGEKASNGDMAVQVNSVQELKNIPTSSEYLSGSASSGMKYVMLDITVFNQQEEETVTVSDFLSTEIQDGQGYTYDSSIMTDLERGFGSGDILPGGEKRGRIAFEVPENASDMEFKYEFSLFESGTAVFELPEKETRYSIDYEEKPEPEASTEIVSVDSSWTEYDSQYLSDEGTIDGVEFNIENTGGISFTPQVGLTITHEGEEIYSSEDEVMFYTELGAGETSTEDVIMYQTVDQPGEYTFKTTVRQEGSDQILAEDTYTETVQ